MYVGLLAYGVLNFLYYTLAFGLAWKGGVGLAPAGSALGTQASMGMSGRLSMSGKRFLKVMTLVWAGSQATKPLRVAGALALGPLAERGLTATERRMGFRSQEQAFTALCSLLLSSMVLLFAGVVICSSLVAPVPTGGIQPASSSAVALWGLSLCSGFLKHQQHQLRPEGRRVLTKGWRSTSGAGGSPWDGGWAGCQVQKQQGIFSRMPIISWATTARPGNALWPRSSAWRGRRVSTWPWFPMTHSAATAATLPSRSKLGDALDVSPPSPSPAAPGLSSPAPGISVAPVTELETRVKGGEEHSGGGEAKEEGRGRGAGDEAEEAWQEEGGEGELPPGFRRPRQNLSPQKMADLTPPPQDNIHGWNEHPKYLLGRWDMGDLRPLPPRPAPPEGLVLLPPALLWGPYPATSSSGQGGPQLPGSPARGADEAVVPERNQSVAPSPLSSSPCLASASGHHPAASSSLDDGSRSTSATLGSDGRSPGGRGGGDADMGTVGLSSHHPQFVVLKKDGSIKVGPPDLGLSPRGWRFTPANRRILFEVDVPARGVALRYSLKVKRVPHVYTQAHGNVKVRPMSAAGWEGTPGARAGNGMTRERIPSSDKRWPKLADVSMDKRLKRKKEEGGMGELSAGPGGRGGRTVEGGG
ncbi:unnamed protein product [Discosporangium mesarthrocarpum]